MAPAVGGAGLEPAALAAPISSTSAASRSLRFFIRLSSFSTRS